MPLSTTPWSNFDASDYKTASAYADACLINLNTGPRGEWTKDKLFLPVREPNGSVNVHGMAAAAAVLAGARGGVDVPLAAKQAAARKLIALYRGASMNAPQSLKDLAGSGEANMDAAIRGR